MMAPEQFTDVRDALELALADSDTDDCDFDMGSLVPASKGV